MSAPYRSHRCVSSGCGDAFYSAFDLEQHQDERQHHQCPKCYARFALRFYLDEHTQACTVIPRANPLARGALGSLSSLRAQDDLYSMRQGSSLRDDDHDDSSMEGGDEVAEIVRRVPQLGRLSRTSGVSARDILVALMQSSTMGRAGAAGGIGVGVGGGGGGAGASSVFDAPAAQRRKPNPANVGTGGTGGTGAGGTAAPAAAAAAGASTPGQKTTPTGGAGTGASGGAAQPRGGDDSGLALQRTGTGAGAGGSGVSVGSEVPGLAFERPRNIRARPTGGAVLPRAVL